MTNVLSAPREVVAAVAGQCITIAVGVGTFAAMNAFPGPWWDTVIFWAILSGLLYFFFRALLRGTNWARWLLLVIAILGLLTTPAHLSALHEQWRRILYVFQGIVQAITV